MSWCWWCSRPSEFRDPEGRSVDWAAELHDGMVYVSSSWCLECGRCGAVSVLFIPKRT